MGLVVTLEDGTLKEGIALNEQEQNSKKEKIHRKEEFPVIVLNEKKVVPLPVRNILMRNGYVTEIRNEPYHIIKIGKHPTNLLPWTIIDKIKKEDINKIKNHRIEHDKSVGNIIDSFLDKLENIDGLGDEIIKGFLEEGHGSVDSNRSVISDHLSCTCWKAPDIKEADCPQIASVTAISYDDNGLPVNYKQAIIGIKAGTSVNILLGNINKTVKIFRLETSEKGIKLIDSMNDRLIQGVNLK